MWKLMKILSQKVRIKIKKPIECRKKEIIIMRSESKETGLKKHAIEWTKVSSLKIF